MDTKTHPNLDTTNLKHQVEKKSSMDIKTHPNLDTLESEKPNWKQINNGWQKTPDSEFIYPKHSSNNPILKEN